MDDPLLGDCEMLCHKLTCEDCGETFFRRSERKENFTPKEVEDFKESAEQRLVLLNSIHASELHKNSPREESKYIKERIKFKHFYGLCSQQQYDLLRLNQEAIDKAEEYEDAAKDALVARRLIY